VNNGTGHSGSIKGRNFTISWATISFFKTLLHRASYSLRITSWLRMKAWKYVSRIRNIGPRRGARLQCHILAGLPPGKEPPGLDGMQSGYEHGTDAHIYLSIYNYEYSNADQSICRRTAKYEYLCIK
jgi:hypothetical protein